MNDLPRGAIARATRIGPAARVLGVPVCGLPLQRLLDVAFQRVQKGDKTLFTTANAHSVVVARHLPPLAAHFRTADAVLPDGISVVWGARAAGGAVAERVAGPDFFASFLERAATLGVSVFLLGTTDDTLGRLCLRLRRRWPALRVAGALAPPFGEFSPEADRALVAAVNEAHPDALFVAMTAPKQELWLTRHLRELDVRFAMGVGAAFDFLAETKRRAPRMVGRWGLEWLFRLVSEPRRMWRRNLDSIRFVALLIAEALLRRWRGEPRPLNARQATRVPLRCPATVAGVAARTFDVSAGGVGVEVDRDFPAGAQLEGVVTVDGRPFAFEGEVAWEAPAGTQRLARRLGVGFRRTSAGLGAALARAGVAGHAYAP